MTNNESAPATGGRLLSLDALRGFDMMFIMGLSAIIVNLCGLFPGGEDCWLATQMSHVDWEGFRHHDTIFALFLFISGMTFPFSFAKKTAKGMSRRTLCLDVLRRCCVLIFLGFVYQGIFQFHFATQRFPSVLARIGLAWAIAAILYMFTSKKTQWGIAAGILVGYFLLLKFVVAPDAPAGADSFSIEGNIAYYIDRVLMPNHIYKKGLGDPEGLLSTIPAVVTAMLGMFTGRYVKESSDSGERKTVKMLAAAAVMAVLTIVWSFWCPVIKSLWTSTFVLAAGAWSVGMFALFYYLIDVKGWRKGVVFFQVVGMNSITIYLGQRILNINSITKFFFGGTMDLLPESWSKLVFSIGYFAVCWFLLYFLYRKKCFLKV